METMLQGLVIVGGLTFSLAASLLIEELIFGQIVRVAFARRPEARKQDRRIERSITMLLLKHLLLSVGIAMFAIAAGILSYDAYLLIAWQRRRLNPDPEAGAPGLAPAMRWRTSVALVMLAWVPLLVSAGIVIVPSGMAGVRVSQTKGTLAGTLYPGVHFVCRWSSASNFSTRATSCSPPASAKMRRPRARRKATRCAYRPRRVSRSASPSPSATRSTPSASTTLRPTCRSLWKGNRPACRRHRVA